MNFGDNLKKMLDEKGISQRHFRFMRCGFMSGYEHEGNRQDVYMSDSG